MINFSVMTNDELELIWKQIRRSISTPVGNKFKISQELIELERKFREEIRERIEKHQMVVLKKQIRMEPQETYFELRQSDSIGKPGRWNDLKTLIDHIKENEKERPIHRTYQVDKITITPLMNIAISGDFENIREDDQYDL